MTDQPRDHEQPESTAGDTSEVGGGGMREWTLVGVAAIGLAMAGFLSGIGEPVSPARPINAPRPVTESAPTAPSYRELPDHSTGVNSAWSSEFSRLKQERPDLFDPVQRTPDMKQAALVDRLRTRAFDGAPPVVPHPVREQAYANCLVCHGEGMRLGERVAVPVSHPRFSNCTQCHVESAGRFPFELQQVAVENDFSGRLRAGAGSRAAPGAPPTIPHTTHLRADCLSCHGLVARPGLRTTHPWLQNCVQCHAPGAELDQHPGIADDPHVRFSSPATVSLLRSAHRESSQE